MEKGILKLAAYLLQQYASELSNNGCNDTENEVLEMINEIGKENFQQIADEWNNGECEYAENYDWIVANVIAYKLEQMSE